jgi:hypothetical protein
VLPSSRGALGRRTVSVRVHLGIGGGGDGLARALGGGVDEPLRLVLPRAEARVERGVCKAERLVGRALRLLARALRAQLVAQRELRGRGEGRARGAYAKASV